jgi:hypothetical protein
MGDNGRIAPVHELPVIGKGTNSRLTMYHQGATVGYFSSFYLFPETGSAVIVLTNSIANCDAADWIAKAMIQALFDDQSKVDWVEVTKCFTRKCLSYYDDMQAKIHAKRQNGPPARGFEPYLGDYYDDTGIFFIRVKRDANCEDRLQLEFQCQDKQAYSLRFFYDDTFEWTLTRDETAKRARYHQFDQNYFNFHFHEDDQGEITSLAWSHDSNVPEGETFTKRAVSELVVHGRKFFIIYNIAALSVS